MKKRKISLLWMAGLIGFAMGAIFISACEEKDGDENGDGNGTGTGAGAGASSVTLSADTLIMKAEGASATFTVTSNGNWRMPLPAEQWLAVFPMKGDTGETAVTLTVDPLLAGSAGGRIASLRILNGDNVEAATLTVQQQVVHPKKVTHTLSATSVELSDKGGMRLLRLVTNTWWSVAPNEDWLHVDIAPGLYPPGSYYIKVSADENASSTAERAGTVTLTIKDEVPIAVTQGKAGDYWNDGEVVMIHEHDASKIAAEGHPYPVVIVGDGFDRQDLKKSGPYGNNGNGGGYGWWEFFGREIANELMTVDMFEDLLPYIDIYLLMSESPERGVNGPPHTPTKTKFNTHGAWENSDKVIAAARAIVPSNPYAGQKNEDDYPSIIFMANGSYPGNASDPLARMGIDEQSYIYWAVHEFAGHIVSDMPDLYCGGPLPVNDEFRLDIDTQHQELRYWFVDYTNDPNEVIWKDFIGGSAAHQNNPNDPADTIGVYPTCFFVFGKGADGKTQELWRPNKFDAMDTWYLCHGLGTRMQMWYYVMHFADPAKATDIEAFKAADILRTPHPCAYRTSPYRWNNYANGKLNQKGDYDRFWRALWP
jgi:hypothetical protein